MNYYKLTLINKSKITFKYLPGGILSSIDFELTEPLTEPQENWFKENLPFRESQIKAWFNLKIGGKFEQVKHTKNQEKLALFCGIHKETFNVNYHINATEQKMMSAIKVDREILLTFFQKMPWIKNKTIYQLNQNYNNAYRLTYGKPLSEFPVPTGETYRVETFWLDALTTEQLDRFRKLMHESGYIPAEKDKAGRVILWRKK